MKVRILSSLAALAVLASVTGCSTDSNDDDAAGLALLALAAAGGGTAGDNASCGVVDLGTTYSNVASIGVTTSARQVTLTETAAGKYIGLALALDAPAASEYTVTYSSQAGGQSAYTDFACPIDQGASNGDTVPTSRVTAGTAGTTQQVFTVNEAGSFAFVFTYFDASAVVTVQRTR